MTKVRRVAAVGAGYFSQFHHDAWNRLGVDLVAVCDEAIEKADAASDRFGIAKSYDDLEHLLEHEQPDLLDIVAPPETHAEHIRAAIAHNVICQKPFTTSLEETEQIVDEASAEGIHLIVHENFRFQPWHRRVKRLLDAGELGELYSLCFRLRPGDGQGPNAYLDRQPYFPKMKRFLIHETAVHFIDLFRYLFGEIRAVFAQLHQRNPAISGEDGGVVLFNFDSGAQGLFDGNRLADHAAENRRLTMGEMLIEGSEACVRLDGDGRLWKRRHGNNHEHLIDYSWDNRGFGGDCVYHLQKHIMESLAAHTPVTNTGREYLTNLRIEAAIYHSHESGTMVTL